MTKLEELKAAYDAAQDAADAARVAAADADWDDAAYDAAWDAADAAYKAYKAELKKRGEKENA
jgi:hypothetical protein